MCMDVYGRLIIDDGGRMPRIYTLWIVLYVYLWMADTRLYLVRECAIPHVCLVPYQWFKCLETRMMVEALNQCVYVCVFYAKKGKRSDGFGHGRMCVQLLFFFPFWCPYKRRGTPSDPLSWSVAENGNSSM